MIDAQNASLQYTSALHTTKHSNEIQLYNEINIYFAFQFLNNYNILIILMCFYIEINLLFI